MKAFGLLLTLIFLSTLSHADTPTGFTFSPRFGYDLGSIKAQNNLFDVASLVGQLEIGYRPHRGYKFFIAGFGQSFPATIEEQELGTFIHTGVGGGLRFFFFAPIFVEGGGFYTHLKYTGDDGAIIEDPSNSFFVGMGAEFPLGKAFTWDIGIRSLKSQFVLNNFDEGNIFQVLTGFTLYP
jgi:hypothetical protein